MADFSLDEAAARMAETRALVESALPERKIQWKVIDTENEGRFYSTNLDTVIDRVVSFSYLEPIVEREIDSRLFYYNLAVYLHEFLAERPHYRPYFHHVKGFDLPTGREIAEAMLAGAGERETADLLSAASTGSVTPTHEDESRVSVLDLMTAVNDPEAEFQTVDDLAAKLNTSPAHVTELLREYPELVRRLPVTDRHGRRLIVSARRPPTWRERLLRIRAYAAKLT